MVWCVWGADVGRSCWLYSIKLIRFFSCRGASVQVCVCGCRHCKRLWISSMKSFVRQYIYTFLWKISHKVTFNTRHSCRHKHINNHSSSYLFYSNICLTCVCVCVCGFAINLVMILRPNNNLNNISHSRASTRHLSLSRSVPSTPSGSINVCTTCGQHDTHSQLSIAQAASATIK